MKTNLIYLNCKILCPLIRLLKIYSIFSTNENLFFHTLISVSFPAIEINNNPNECKAFGKIISHYRTRDFMSNIIYCGLKFWSSCAVERLLFKFTMIRFYCIEIAYQKYKSKINCDFDQIRHKAVTGILNFFYIK